MKDDFPDMPSRKCPDCPSPKKIMFFAPKQTYCREHSKERTRAARKDQVGAIDSGYGFNRLPIGNGRAG